MAEITPQINLTKVEQYQAHRSSPELSRDNLSALSWRIATQPSLYLSLIPNPYSRDSLQTMTESFPDINPPDVIKATVLAEPEGAYDRNFKQLSHQEQRKVLYQQIDQSATITVRLEKYLQKRPQAFWDMSEDRIYSLLSEVAFGTSDLSGIEKNFAQNQRRGFRLSIVNFIEDLKTLKPYRERFDDDPKATANKIFGREINGDVEVESLPIGFVIYLKAEDYHKLSPPKEVGEAPGGTFYEWDVSYFPPELIGKVIIINKDFRIPEAMKSTRDHELRHMIFASFVAESDHTLDTAKTLDELHTPQDHKQYSETLRKFFAEYARNEIIAYFGSGDAEYKFLGQLGGDKWLGHLEKVRNNLWTRDDLTAEQKSSIYTLYTGKFADYLGQIREYQWIALRLFKSGISTEKAEALLQNVPFDKARRLGRYFGVDPDDIPTEISKEQEQMIKRFSGSVDTLTKPSAGGLPLSEQPMILWSGLMDWDAQSQVRLTYPREAIPDLVKVIERFNEPDVVDEAIYSTELILSMHHKEMSQQDLTYVKSALENMVSKRTGDNFTRVKVGAENLIQTIDEVYMHGGVDFIHNMPLIVKVSDLMRVPEGQSPTLDQVSQLIELLKGKDASVWSEYFRVEYIDLLKGPKAIPIAIKLADATTYAGFTVKALGILESDLDKLTPEIKKEALTVIETILLRTYRVGSVDITEKLRPYALQVKNELEND